MLRTIAILAALSMCLPAEEASAQAECNYCTETEFGLYACCGYAIQTNACMVYGCHHEGCVSCSAIDGGGEEELLLAFRADESVESRDVLWHGVNRRWLDLVARRRGHNAYEVDLNCGRVIRIAVEPAT